MSQALTPPQQAYQDTVLKQTAEYLDSHRVHVEDLFPGMTLHWYLTIDVTPRVASESAPTTETATEIPDTPSA